MPIDLDALVDGPALAAGPWKLSPSTLRTWVARGRLVSRGRRGRRALYRYGDVAELVLGDHRQGSSPP